MHIVQQVIFVLVVAAATLLFAKNVKKIRRNILLGRDVVIEGGKRQRWKNVLLLAIGQKKMFKYPVVAILHLLIYAGFIIINIEIAEIILDGIFGTHRLFLPALGGIYTFLLNSFEILAAGVIAACIVFLWRRNLLVIKRFRKKELIGWPKTDANVILVTEIILMLLFLTMNAADKALQLQQNEYYSATANFYISGSLSSLFTGLSTISLMAIERTCWWLHIVGILAFLNYLPYSKHFHIILAFPNTYYADISPMGQFKNMENIQNEVLYAMQPELASDATENTQSFGAKDIADLTYRNLMDAYSCTECGRCTDACPANMTGKKLNPRKIMMDTRDRMEEVGRGLDTGTVIGKTLLHDYITAEELRACTTCQACVEACPVSIDPLDIIVQLRRYLIMEESNAPAEWNAMFSNVENNFAPWKFSPDDRDNWIKGS